MYMLILPSMHSDVEVMPGCSMYVYLVAQELTVATVYVYGWVNTFMVIIRYISCYKPSTFIDKRNKPPGYIYITIRWLTCVCKVKCPHVFKLTTHALFKLATQALFKLTCPCVCMHFIDDFSECGTCVTCVWR